MRTKEEILNSTALASPEEIQEYFPTNIRDNTPQTNNERLYELAKMMIERGVPLKSIEFGKDH